MVRGGGAFAGESDRPSGRGPGVWAGVVLFAAGVVGTSGQVALMVAGEATSERWFVLVLMVLIAVSGLGLFRSARRQTRTCRDT